MRQLFLFALLLVLTACQSSTYKSMMETGEEQFAAGEYRVALTMFEKALSEKNTDEVNEWLSWTNAMLEGQQLMEEERWEEAKQFFEDLQKRPATVLNPTLHQRIGQAEQKQIAQALKEPDIVAEALAIEDDAKRFERIEHLLTNERTNLKAEQLEALKGEKQTILDETKHKKKEHTTKPVNNRQATIDHMETQVNGQAYVNQVVQTITQAFEEGASTLQPYQNMLSPYLTSPMLNDYMTHYKSGALCYECDMELIPGHYNPLKFIRYADVSPTGDYVYVDYSTYSDWYGYSEYRFRYELDGKRWKIAEIKAKN